MLPDVSSLKRWRVWSVQPRRQERSQLLAALGRRRERPHLMRRCERRWRLGRRSRGGVRGAWRRRCCCTRTRMRSWRDGNELLALPGHQPVWPARDQPRALTWHVRGYVAHSNWFQYWFPHSAIQVQHAARTRQGKRRMPAGAACAKKTLAERITNRDVGIESRGAAGEAPN